MALQGAVREHACHIQALGAEYVLVKRPRDLEEINALIIPGGESTAIGKLMSATGLDDSIKTAAEAGMPVFGTCAGMILMAKRTVEPAEHLLGLMDISVRRNAYGRQVDSFETDLRAELGKEVMLKAVFIRAPAIESVGPGVKVLAEYGGRPVMVEEKNFLACSFHPELTGESRVHEHFLERAKTSIKIEIAE